jgi:Putative Flp pilus-assembly TadE/G-like
MHRTVVPRGDRATRQRGQVLVIVVVALAGLFAAAGLAFDIGRFYSERRFVQNSADAAALAAANALIRGENASQADVRAREILTINFAHSPSGVSPALPPSTPVYQSGHAGEPAYLINGILITGQEVRVAVQSQVGYTFGRIVGLTSNTITGQARVVLQGRLLPIAVRNFINPSGPNAGATTPCSDDRRRFMDFFATADTSCLGTDSDDSLRTEASAGNAFDPSNPGSDPSHHGPVIEMLGQGAQPNNGADFRGFLALDIRNFQAIGTQQYFNGVTAATNPTTLKSLEANWVTIGGYPGPLFPPITSPPDPNDEAAAMNGNSTGTVIDEVAKRFAMGDEVLVAVYSGNVSAIPDFGVTTPATVSLPTTGTVATAGTIKVSRNQAFSGQVSLSTLADTLDPANPMVLGTLTGGSSPITYTPNPVTPSLGSGQTVQLTNMTTAGAAHGIYTLWIQAQAGSPYLTTKLIPFPIKVGNVAGDFSMSVDSSDKVAVNSGDTVTFRLSLTNSSNGSYGRTVALSLDGPLPSGIGPVTFSPSSLTPTSSGTISNLTINTGTLPTGRYNLTVRATGVNNDSTPRPVTHLLPLTVDVQTGDSGNQNYVDITGFALMRIASDPLTNSNTIWAYAITPVISDPDDPRLRRGQAARLVPWN